MSDDDLELNTLDRFRKRSNRLILEQHSHCEVPAGCGGVVLRWVTPETSVLQLHWYTNAGASRLLVDGEEPQTSRLTLYPGDHVLAIELTQVPGAVAQLVFLLTSDPEVVSGVNREGPLPDVQTILSEDDGTWVYTGQQPREGWPHLAFDDSSWHEMASAEVPEPLRGAPGNWSWTRATSHGARGLSARAHRGRVWIRKRFNIAADQDEPSAGES